MARSSTPLVSVIVPVFNTLPYLKECLDSLAVQTLHEIEIICVDNGSTDGSYEYLLNYAKGKNRFSVIQHVFGRQGAARNAGIEFSRGRFVGFVDSDDFVSPNMFELMVDAATSQQASVVVCNMNLFFEAAHICRPFIDSDLLSYDGATDITQKPHLLKNLTICNKLVNREFMERFRLRFPEDVFFEDQHFVAASLLLAQRIATIAEPLYYYRQQRPGSVNQDGGNDANQIFTVMQKLTDFLHSVETRPDLRRIADETRALQYIRLYKQASSAQREVYFVRMQAELATIDVTKSDLVMSRSEKREAQMARILTRFQFDAYLLLRKWYGGLRKLLGRRALQNGSSLRHK